MMIPRSLTLGLLGLSLAGSTPAVLGQTKDATPARKKPALPTPTKELIKRAIRAANDDRPLDAVSELAEALKQAPDNRDALDLMVQVTGMAADKVEDPKVKISLLKQADEAYEKLKKKFKPLFPDEVRIGESLQLNPALIATLDNKPAEALDHLTKLVASGYDRVVMIEMMPDFESVRKLPDYASRMLQASQVGTKVALADFKSFPFDFSLKTVEGQAVKLADLKGNVAIVDVWGTWCPPCREEIPHFVDLAGKYGDKGLKIVGINCNEEGSPAEVKKTINDFIAQHKIPYPCVLNEDSVESKIPDFEGYPTTLFLDRTGKVRLKLIGYQPAARLEAIITTLMAEPAR